MPEATKLRLIEVDARDGDFGLIPQSEEGDPTPLDSDLGRPMLRRPGDHVESVFLEPVAELEALRLQGCQRGLHPDTAVAIVTERRLAAAQLCSGGTTGIVGWLDRFGEGQRPRIELWSANSAYLRHLLHGADTQPSRAELRSSRAALPIRIVDRVGRQMPAAFEPSEAELNHSIIWEIAALLSGETLSEWAYRVALGRSPEIS